MSRQSITIALYSLGSLWWKRDTAEFSSRSKESSAKTDKEMADWDGIWENKGEDVPWQVTGPHDSLVKHINLLTDGKPNQHILVPLCGASDDLLWLADQGHTVVGIEGTKKAIKIFFDKNKLEYEVSAINLAPSGAYIYKAKHKNITIVEVDFWHFRQSIVGKPFDAVWDRAALIAVLSGTSGDGEIETGKKYLHALKDSLKPDGRVLLETLLFDPEQADKHGGPHFLSNERLKAMSNTNWNMEQVELIAVPANVPFMQNIFTYDIEMCLHLLKPK